jgi:hypothetical protein
MKQDGETILWLTMLRGPSKVMSFEMYFSLMPYGKVVSYFNVVSVAYEGRCHLTEHLIRNTPI